MKKYKKQSTIYKCKEWHTPFPIPTRFILSGNNSIYIISVINRTTIEEFKTYTYETEVEYFVDELTQADLELVTFMASRSLIHPELVTRIAKDGYVSHLRLINISEDIITEDEYVKLLLTKNRGKLNLLKGKV